MEVIVLLVLFSVGIGFWANSWGRNGLGWGVVALLLSPLLTGIVLLFMGKTLEKKAQEIKAINELVNK